MRNKIVTLNFSQYSIGNIVLGYVLQVGSNHLVVSLPGGVIGTINSTNITDIQPSVTAIDTDDAESNVRII